jgi:hypothetical protein
MIDFQVQIRPDMLPSSIFDGLVDKKSGDEANKSQPIEASAD